jgi:hypothetical protein
MLKQLKEKSDVNETECIKINVGRDSSVGIEPSSILDGQGIESRWGLDFPHPSGPVLGPCHVLCNGYLVSFPGVKRPGRGVDHPVAPRIKKN